MLPEYEQLYYQAQPKINKEFSSQDQEVQQIQETQKSSNYTPKIVLPSNFYHAKKTLTKMINNLFVGLKIEYAKRGGQIYMNRQQLLNIQAALHNFVGISHSSNLINLNLNLTEIIKNNQKNQKLQSIYAYISQSQKIVSYSNDGTVYISKLQLNNNLIPDIATPIPYKDQIYLLDGCSLHEIRKVFIPFQLVLQITAKGQVKILENQPKYHRMKCAISIKDQQIYLIGGYITQEKAITRSCQKFSIKSKQFTAVASLNYKHCCPSSCVLNGSIWVLSPYYIQYLQGQEWRSVAMPFGAIFYPFQYTFGLSNCEILIFGGICCNRKMSTVSIFDTNKLTINNYGVILPQGICNERTWGPIIISRHIAVLSNIQASIYPHVGIKSNTIQLISISEIGAYLNNILNV